MLLVLPIAVVHSVFNITVTLCLLPFKKWLVKLAMFTIRDSSTTQEDNAMALLDERFLEKPAFAVAQAKKQQSRWQQHPKKHYLKL